MAPTLAWKLERVMGAAKVTQAELAARSGLNQGNISSILNGKQHSLRPDTAQRLAAALSGLELPAVYFLSDQPRDYLATKLANLPRERVQEIRSWSLELRVFWLLADLEEKWGNEFGLEAVAAATEVDLETIQAMCSGRRPLTRELLNGLADYIGVPVEFFLIPAAEVPTPLLPPAYLELGRLAWSLLLDPDMVAKGIRLLYDAAHRERSGQAAQWRR